MRRLLIASLILVLTASCVVVPGRRAAAAINPLISFQGKLTNPDGTNVTDNTYTLVFSIYTVSSGGTAVWTESKSVTVSGGLFQTNLGDTTTLPGSVNFNSSPLYLGIKVGTDAEMTPRVQLTAAPYAFDADKLDGIDSTGLVQLSPGAQQTGNINIGGTITSGAVNGLTLTQAADGFAVAGGTTSRTLTVQGADITVGNTIKPTSAGALTLQSNGANPLSIDVGGASTINIGTAGVATTISVGNGTSNPNISFSGSGTFGTTTGAVSLNGNVTVASGKTLTLTSGGFSQTFTASTASNAQTIALTNNNTGAGVAINGVNLTPTNTSTPSSGVNSLNVINFAAGGALGGSDTTNGINFASSTGYSNFINSPSFVLSSSGAISGVTTLSTSSTINSNTFSSSTLTFGAASTATVQSAASQALTITANAASTWSTSAGNLTVQAGSGTVSLGSSTILTATGALTLNSGAATALTVDSGTTGALNIGTSANAKTITIGNTTGATTIAHLVGTGTNVFNVQGPSSAVLFQIDSTNSRVYVGNPTADATGVLLVLDSKNTTGDPTGVNGSEYYNSANNRFRCYQGGSWYNCLDQANSSTGSQSPTAGATTYITGSNMTIPSGGLHVGTQFVWRIAASKTAAGTAASSILVKYGTNGTTADTTVITLTGATETAVADTGMITVTVTVQSVSSTGTWTGNMTLQHNGNTGGMATVPVNVVNATSATFNDTTTNAIVGLAFTAGTSDAFTFTEVQANALNL
jgi:hypothetical protein